MHVLRRVQLPWVPWGAARWAVLGICIAAGLAARVSVYHVQTDDYTYFISRWYEFLAQNGGFHALKYDLSNYNPPYLYLLTIATYIPIPELAAIKTVSVVFDVVLAAFTFLILRLKYPRATIPVVGALVAFLAPTVIINSAAWGQCDAIYTAFCLGSLYFLLTDRPAWAAIFFGLACSFKLQAIFFAPVLLLLLLRGKRSALCLLLVPLTCAVLLLPAIAAGRDVQSLLHIYVDQVETGGMTTVQMPVTTQSPASLSGWPTGNSRPQAQLRAGYGFGHGPGTGAAPGLGRRGGQGLGAGVRRLADRGRADPGGGSYSFSPSAFTFNAPSFYQWLPTGAPAYWKWIGTFLAGLFAAILGVIAFLNRDKLTREVVITIALLSVVALPFLLPKMHERYFYAADVLSITFAFFSPRFFFVAIVVQVSSLLSYAPYFLDHDRPPAYLAYVAVAILLLILVLAAKLAASLYRDRVASVPESVSAPP